MFEKNLGTDTDQNDTCPKFGLEVDALTEVHSNEASDD